MRRGQSISDDIPPDQGLSKQELLDVCDLSAKTFDTIRKAARIKGPNHGGHAHVFSHEDVIALILRAESGNFTERGAPAARAWRTLLEERGITLDPPKRLGTSRRQH